MKIVGREPVGKGIASGTANKRVVVRVRLSDAAKRKLAKQRKVVLTLKLVVRDVAGNATATKRKVTAAK